jgi:hypothetical protein
MKNKERTSKMTNIQHIVKFALEKKPSQMKNYVNKEIAAKVMDRIESKRASVGASLFGN